MENIKAIIFDAYGTLFDVNSAAEKSKEKIGDKWENFANHWRTTQLEYTWLRSLMGRHKDFWQITEDSLDKSMKYFNIEKSIKKELLNLYKILSTFPEVNDVLNKLRKKNYKLAILSNGTNSLLKELVEINSYFDEAFGEEVVEIKGEKHVVHHSERIAKWDKDDLILFEEKVLKLKAAKLKLDEKEKKEKPIRDRKQEYKKIDDLLFEALIEKLEEGRPEKMEEYLKLRKEIKDKHPLEDYNAISLR